MTPEKHHPRTHRASRALDRTIHALWIFGVACLAWVGWSLMDAAVVEAYEGWKLDRARSHLETSAPPVTGDHGDSAAGIPADSLRRVEWPVLEEGDLVGRVEIARLDISTVVLHGSSARTLRRSVGHIPGTALPGQDGNVGLAGHRDTFFRPLEAIEVGDTVTVETPHGDFLYEVDTLLVVQPEDVYVLDPPASGEMLTLVTCFPFYYVGPAPQRFIVQGRRIETD